MKNQPSPIASFISCTGEEYEKIRQQRKAHPGIEAVEPDDLMTVSFQLPLASVMELDKLAAVHDEIRVTMLRKIVEAYLRDHHGDLEDAEEAVD